MVSQHFFLRINSHGSKSTLRTHARSGGWVAVCGCERASAVHPVSKHHPYTASVSPCQPYPAHPDTAITLRHRVSMKLEGMAEMSRLSVAQVFSLLALSLAAPPDLATDVERVEVIAGAKDLLLPCRCKNLNFPTEFCQIFSRSVWIFYLEMGEGGNQ